MNAPIAIVFVDIGDSTGLYERLGDVAAARVTQDLLVAIGGTAASHGGRVVKHLGDGLLLTFAKAEQAFLAIEQILPPAGAASVMVRAAAHLGPVVQRDGSGDVFGDAVNLAARLEGMARPGEALASGDFVTALPQPLRERTELFDSLVVRGRSTPTSVWRLRVVPEDGATVLRGIQAPAPPRRMLQLLHAGRTLELSSQGSLVIGRDEDCDLVLCSPLCSRRHAVIGFVRDRFIVEDRSTNGTWVRPRLSAPIFLRRESASLFDDGTLGLGGEAGDDRGHLVQYRIVAR